VRSSRRHLLASALDSNRLGYEMACASTSTAERPAAALLHAPDLAVARYKRILNQLA